jgi:hypothetical protein
MRLLVLFFILLVSAGCRPRLQQRQRQEAAGAPAGFSIEAAVPGSRLGSVAAFTLPC